MRLWTTALAILLAGVPLSHQQFSSLFGADEDEVVVEVDSNDGETDAEVEGVVQQLASQLRSTIKSQIQGIKSGSKLGGSRFSTLTELHIAVANNQYELAERLLNDGADVDAKSPAQMTPLHSAADGGYKDIANLLLAHNATIDMPVRGARRATHANALRSGRLACSGRSIRSGRAGRARCAAAGTA
jgi:ankyrin repeat protein